ncbi:MAG: lytic transglycosylase domain-containing protein [candidate division KSB1 bacterium]|nr:lytic transglycosylase domain-containing protein [candidate division KSB1 bacterium]MDQ7064444.1 lytic transglycosylase domain-containing protein [candidate division KSB1 bacterium]
MEKTMNTDQARAPRTRAIAKILGLFVLSSVLIGFTFQFASITHDQRERIRELERSLQTLKAAINIDSVRQYNIQKVINIINRHNPDMPSDLKYQIANEIYEMSIKYTNLDVDLICATITHESNHTWDPEIVSRAGAMGLMQIMPTTGMYVSQLEGIPWTTPEEVLFNPIYNIRIGCRYLSSMISIYDVDGGLAAYNGGERIASLWLKNDRDDNVLWAETRKYIPSVLKLYEQYQNMN